MTSPDRPRVRPARPPRRQGRPGADRRRRAALRPASPQSLEETIADLSERPRRRAQAPRRHRPGGLDRDHEVHRLTARLRALRRFSLDLCLGRIVAEGDGRAATTSAGSASPTAPAPAARRLALPRRRAVLRRHPRATRWAWPAGAATAGRGGRITDYWDEVFTADGLEGHAALDDQSAFIASLGSSRSARMRDVLGTIQADQDAIIRAGSRGALVVDGGPGTGKTVVALHRTAYLLYADPRLGHRRGGVLFVGPHQPYLAYVADVLPSLGEEGVQTCTCATWSPRAAARSRRRDPEVARAQGRPRGWSRRSSRPSRSTRSRPPRRCWSRRRGPTSGCSADDWAEAFDVARPGHPAQRGARRGLGGAARRSSSTRHDDDEVSADQLRRVAARGTPSCAAPSTRPGRCSSRPTSSATCGRCRRTCAAARPGSTPDEVRLLQREDPHAWTTPTCRSSTPPGCGSATPRRRGAGAAARPPWRPSGSRWPRSSTT